MKHFAAVILLLQPVLALAQSPQVPHKMQVAGITLSIRDDARREIQKDVDALTQYPKYFNAKVERAKMYFPLIEQIFREERVPDDFKYLVLQESALIADAVSVSNAVGFWQFKDFTALEMGLRVDREIDERMNIVSSTRAAAQYLKKNNYYFNNWLYALQAYQMGAGAVMRAYNDYESGAKHMEITSSTYWYVKKFLAHKVAFEGAVTGPARVKLLMFTNHRKKTLADIAREIEISEEKLSDYNKWIRHTHIPDDRSYAVVIPVEGYEKAVYSAVARNNEAAGSALSPIAKTIETKPPHGSSTELILLNGIPAVKAREGESSAALASRSGINLSSFLKFNDLSISDPLTGGSYYYVKRKRSKAGVLQHVASEGETLWQISQQHGIQLKKIKKYNPGLADSGLKRGTVINLVSPGAAVRPALVAEVVELDSREAFTWFSTPPAGEVAVAGIADAPRLEPTVKETFQADRHVVAAGETLYAISKKYNVGVLDLATWNNLSLEQGIKPGQELMVRKPEQGNQPAGNFIVYEVKPTDTLYSVARDHGVTIKQLMDWNSKTDFSVTAGEQLKIQRQ